MWRRWIALGTFWLAAAGIALAQPEGIVRVGTVKAVDASKATVTIALSGDEHEYAVDDATRIAGAAEPVLKERMGHIPKQGEVEFAYRTKEGKQTLTGIRPALAAAALTAAPPKCNVSALKPLPELENGKYQDSEGGLYPGGQSTPPEAHLAAGVELARQIQPLDAKGQPSPQGKIVLLLLGSTNATRATTAFIEKMASFRGKNPALVCISGAQGGMPAKAILDVDDGLSGARYWTVLPQTLQNANVSPAQVQAVWIQESDEYVSPGFPAAAKTLQAELAKIAQLLLQRFPNLKLVYLSSRTFGGYAKTTLSPEPYAYETGFAVKWLVQQQIDGDEALNYDSAKGPVKAPWLAWGPYLWANGAVRQSDRLPSAPGDFQGEGSLESTAGQAKLGAALLDFFSNDPTATPWFLRGATAAPAGGAQSTTASATVAASAPPTTASAPAALPKPAGEPKPASGEAQAGGGR